MLKAYHYGSECQQNRGKRRLSSWFVETFDKSKDHLIWNRLSCTSVPGGNHLKRLWANDPNCAWRNQGNHTNGDSLSGSWFSSKS